MTNVNSNNALNRALDMSDEQKAQFDQATFTVFCECVLKDTDIGCAQACLVTGFAALVLNSDVSSFASEDESTPEWLLRLTLYGIDRIRTGYNAMATTHGGNKAAMRQADVCRKVAERAEAWLARSEDQIGTAQTLGDIVSLMHPATPDMSNISARFN